MFPHGAATAKSFHWGIIHKQDHKVIGDMWVYLIENDRMAKVAFRLSPACQGKRLMTEALVRAVTFCFEETELQRYLYGMIKADYIEISQSKSALREKPDKK